MSPINTLKYRTAGRRNDFQRTFVQALCASLLSFCLGKALGIDDLSFMVLAAVFAIQEHFHSSVRLALGQIIGCCIGTLVGVAGVMYLRDPHQIILRVGFATCFTAAWAALFPEMIFAVVAATVTAFQHMPDIHTTMSRASGIMLGSICGAAVSWIVHREMGSVRIARTISHALTECKVALLTILQLGFVQVDADRRDWQHRFDTSLREAKSVMEELPASARLASDYRLDVMIDRTEKLWSGVALLHHAPVLHELHAVCATRCSAHASLAQMGDKVAVFIDAVIDQLVSTKNGTPLRCDTDGFLESVLDMRAEVARSLSALAPPVRNNVDRNSVVLFSLDFLVDQLVCVGRAANGEETVADTMRAEIDMNGRHHATDAPSAIID